MSLYIVCNASGMLRASAITSPGKGSMLAIWRDLCIYKAIGSSWCTFLVVRPTRPNGCGTSGRCSSWAVGQLMPIVSVEACVLGCRAYA